MRYLITIALVQALAAPVAAGAGSIFDFTDTIGKTRARVQQLCKADAGTWTKGNCVFEGGDQAVMFDWKNNRATTHSHFQVGQIYGYVMLKTIRKTAGEEDVEMPKDGCDLYLWANVDGLMIGVTICEDNSGITVAKVGGK